MRDGVNEEFAEAQRREPTKPWLRVNPEHELDKWLTDDPRARYALDGENVLGPIAAQHNIRTRAFQAELSSQVWGRWRRK